VLQHAWASISHALQYKQEQDVPTVSRRKLFRLSALLELADEEFLSLRKEQTEVTLSSSRKIKTRKLKQGLRSGEVVLICIRVERVLINPKTTQVNNLIQCTLKRIIFRGTDYEATCQFDDSEIRSVVGATSWDRSLKEGDTIQVGFKSSDVILFPRSEEKDVIKYSGEAV